MTRATHQLVILTSTWRWRFPRPRPAR